MLDYIREFQWNGLLGILLYWVPLVFCAVFYTYRTADGYLRDKASLEKHRAARLAEVDTVFRSHYYYHPTETVGRVLGRALVTVMPVANIWAAMFDLAPKVFCRFINLLGRIFGQPLVPRDEGA